MEDVKKMIQDKVRCRFGDVYKIFGWKGAEIKRRDVGVWSHERHVRNAAKWRSSQEQKVQQTAKAVSFTLPAKLCAPTSARRGGKRAECVHTHDADLHSSWSAACASLRGIVLTPWR